MKDYLNRKVVLITLGALLGVALAIWLVESEMDSTHSFTKFDGTVEIIMKDVFQSPPPVTEHGRNVDRVIVFVHIMMGVLFVGWTFYFLGCLVKFGGMSPMQALVAATKTSAELCGVDDTLGTLEAGKLADIVVVKGDPLADIDSLTDHANILLVLKEGKSAINRGGFSI